MIKIKIFWFLTFFCFVISGQALTKVTCVGASITYGAFIEERQHNSFPGQLQQLLGNQYEVLNLGVSGTTMLKNGNLPYWKTNEFQQALKSNPDENTLPFEQKVKALNGNITVIHKPGFGHHPHSFPNPEPIVKFILNATGYNSNDK